MEDVKRKELTSRQAEIYEYIKKYSKENRMPPTVREIGEQFGIPEEYEGLPLAQTGLKTETGILVMLVEQPGKKAVPAGADTVFGKGDKLTVFGDYQAICKAFHARERFTDT